MIREIKSQSYLLIHKKSFKIALICNILFNAVSYLYQVFKVIGKYEIEVISASYACSISEGNPFWTYYQILFPFIVVIPFAFSYFEDKALNLIYYIETRVEKKKYLIAKVITSFIGSFIVVIIPFLLNILLNEITFPHNGNTFGSNIHSIEITKDLVGENVIAATIQKGLIGLRFFLMYPQLYNIILVFLLAIIAGIMGAFCFCWSYFVQKHKILLFLPVYIYCYIGSIFTRMSEEVGIAINFTLLDYAYLNTNMGKSVIIFLLELIIMIVFIGITTHHEIKQKQ
ncbi:MAG: hypothetical protein HFJ09_10110 [Lachnospiraceae bacterium]|nr:hypothetical protein [Lachnospiraceae bacterium]